MTGVPGFAAWEDELRAEHGAPGEDIVTVSGFTGVGTTTVTLFLCDRFGLDHVDAGSFFREKAAEFGMDIREFEEQAPALEEEHGTDFDREWDRQALQYAYTRDGFVLEGRLSGVLLRDVAPIRILVTCDRETVVERIMEREELDREAAAAYVDSRNDEALARYREKYGVDPEDEAHYNVVLDNSDPFGQVKERLLRKLRELDVDLA